jgi:plastocyanin
MASDVRRLSLGLVVGLVAVMAASCSKSNSTAPAYSGNPLPAGNPELNGNLPTTGSQYPHTFAKAGTFNYQCTIHPGCASLTGTIVVVAPGVAIQNHVLAITQSGGGGGPYASCSSLSLQRDTVFVGDQVTWTNNSPLPHTVTSQ